MSVLERLGLAVPVIGAGLGGGLSTSALTIALGRAGALGQIGILPPDRLRAELAAHRAADAGPVAVNLLLPFARRAQWEAARSADVVVTFWGVPRRPGDGIWVHQCGSVDEARMAASAGVDAVIVQGVEAGGHVRGTTPALELTAQVREALPADISVWTAGGVVGRGDVEAALAAGAEAVVVGTRFLMSSESAAHPLYKQRLVEAKETVLTELFGAGWPAPHRVIHNAATRRWLHDDPRGPAWVRALHRGTAPLLSRAPVAVIQRAARLQRPGMPLLGPAAATAGDPVSLLDSGPLYAGKAWRASTTSAPPPRSWPSSRVPRVHRMTKAFYEPLGNDRYRSTEHTIGPWGPDSQHAGPPSALLSRALEQMPDSWPGTLTRITVDVLGAVPVAELTVRARTVRGGRNVELVEAEAESGGRAVLRAQAWRIRTNDLDLPPAPAGAPVDPVPELPEQDQSFFDWQGGFLAAMQWRFVGGSSPGSGSGTVWGRMPFPLVEGEEPSGLQRLLVVADCGNGVSFRLPLEEWLFINTELTVHLAAPPRGEWICLDATTRLDPAGFGLASSRLFDRTGLVGFGAQTLYVAPRGPVR